MKKCFFKTNNAAANQSRAMEKETIQKNGAISKILMLPMLFAAIFMFSSCTNDEPTPTLPIPQDVVELINSIEMFPVAQEFSERVEVLRDTTWVEWSNDDPRLRGAVSGDIECFAFNTEWTCTTRRVSASRNPDDFAMFNPLASVLWPGNLIQGASLASGVPATIPVTNFRQPGRISLAIVTGGSEGATMYRTVERMSFSGVNQAMNDILSGFPGQGYAQYNFEMDVIRSESELEHILNASFSGWGASARAGLSINESQQMTRILVRLHQAYFTMVFDDPHGLDGVFTPDITVNDLRNYIGDGNPITYISSVTFGRIFYLLYESTASEDDLRAALTVSFRGWGVNASVEAEMRARNVLAETTSRVFQLGGGGEGGITAGMAVDFEAIREFMERGINFGPQNVGAPISYTVKYLKNAQIVRMNSTMEFEIEECIPVVTENVCPEPPRVSTNAVTHITVTAARAGGNISVAGTPAFHEAGIVYCTTPNPFTATGRIPVVHFGTGDFFANLTGLTQNTTYYVWAYAINRDVNTDADVKIWGEMESFTTLSEILPEVSTGNVSNITATAATFTGNIISVGNPPYTERGMVWAETPYPTLNQHKVLNTDGSGTGNFSNRVTGLRPNTRYYVRAFATSTAGTVYGEQMEFRTLVGGGEGDTESINIAIIANGQRGYNNDILVWSFTDNTLRIYNSANLTVTGSVNNGRRILVDADATVNLTLNHVSISGTTVPILLSNRANVTLTLVGNNNLIASAHHAGIQTTRATLTIEGTGSLRAEGGNGLYRGAGAGIGGSGGTGMRIDNNNDGGTITINSGIITAIGGNGGNVIFGLSNGGGGGGAGIGGGGGACIARSEVRTGGIGGTITINGGTVTAMGGAASIGGVIISASVGGGGGGGQGATIGGGGGGGGSGIGGTLGARGQDGNSATTNTGGAGGVGAGREAGGAGGAAGIININGGTVN